MYRAAAIRFRRIRSASSAPGIVSVSLSHNVWLSWADTYVITCDGDLIPVPLSSVFGESSGIHHALALFMISSSFPLAPLINPGRLIFRAEPLTASLVSSQNIPIFSSSRAIFFFRAGTASPSIAVSPAAHGSPNRIFSPFP